jgi:hypothetical protein
MAYGILPLFAFANAGASLADIGMHSGYTLLRFASRHPDCRDPPTGKMRAQH